MKKFFLAAAIAMAPVLAATSADAITVPQGSILEITVTGEYATQDGNDIGIGSVFDLNNTYVSSVNAGAGVTGAPSGFTAVAVPDLFTLDDGANTGVSFTFLGASDASFTISQSGGSVVTLSGTGTGTGGSGQFGLGVLAKGSTENDGSFSFVTTSDSSTGTYLTTFAVPPNEDIEEEFDPISAIPLPAAAWMLLAGLGSLWAFRRRTHA
jgi:hypothetical protein